MTTATDTRTGGEWLQDWDPEDEASWNKALAWRTLWITTFSLTMAFVTWFLPSALVPKLKDIGFVLTKNQLYWLAAMPGLSAGFLRLAWMVLPPIQGTRKMVTMTTALLIVPLVGWGVVIQDATTPYWVLMAFAFLAGIGGGAFSGFMPSTSFFFPKRLAGTALGIQAGIGNFGVSLVQLLTPWLIGFSMVGFLGGPQTAKAKGKAPVQVWYQNAAFFWVPLLIIGIALAWFLLKSVPVKANIKQQFDIFTNVDTWYMTLLYIMTFGTFSGLSGQFGLLMKSLYGADATGMPAGYAFVDPIKYVFLGPLIGAGARVLFSPLTDKMGGAKWTLISGLGLIGSVTFTAFYLSPDKSSAAATQHDFRMFLWGMLAIFLFSGIGNASTFKQMPMIFEKRQAGGVIGWTAAIAAFGPFFFGVGLTLMAPEIFFGIGVAFAVLCVVITWIRYARPGAPKPS